MNRNTEYSPSLAPQAHIQRSTFKGLSHSVKTSFNTGDIVPFYCEEVYPGDTFKIKTSKVVRLQTLISPMMDNLFLDTYFFFVPNRLVWEHWEQFIGGSMSEDQPWIPVPEYSVPQIKAPVGGFKVGSLADYLGFPTGVANLEASALPVRAYGKIINDWFISENLTEPYYVPVNDSNVNAVDNPSDEVNVIVNAARPVKAAKYPDLFTMALPAPQKGPDVQVPIAKDAIFPVHTINDFNQYFSPGTQTNHLWDAQNVINRSYPILYGTRSTHFPGYGGLTQCGYVTESGDSLTNATFTGFTNNGAIYSNVFDDKDGNIVSFMPPDTLGDHYLKSFNDAYENKNNPYLLTPVNLVADGSTGNVFSSINSLRMAFQIQKLYERDARGGSNRYVELLRSHFGVVSPDARLQRAEYLGGSRFPISIHQVTQTSSTVGTSPLGDTAAMSVTADIHSDVNKSFVEHGWIIGVMCARYEHTYQQGLHRQFSRKNRFDFYWPVLSNIGEQPVLNKEIYATGTAKDNEVFGYQEAWAEMRYHTNRVCGEMRSGSNNSLDYWHLADNYKSQPYLSDAWIREDPSNVDRVLSVSSEVSNQIFGDIYLDIVASRPLPLYSVPGLIDHF